MHRRTLSPSFSRTFLIYLAVLFPASALLFVALAKAQLASSPWPMLLNNLSHSGLSTVDTSANTGNVKWQFSTGEEFSSPAVGSDGTIYVGDENFHLPGHTLLCVDSFLYAINPDATQKWNFDTGSCVGSSPAIGGDGTIYVGSSNGNLNAINPDGTQKWKFTTGASILSSPAIAADGTIYVGSGDDNLYAINPAGAQKWKFTTGAFIRSSPAIAGDGTIYIGSNDSNLYAINPDGTQKWKFTTGKFIFSAPAVGSDGTIYIGSGDTNLYAINPDGTQKWAFATGNAVESSPAIGSDGTLYVNAGDGNVYAINPDGSEKWAFAVSQCHVPSPAIGADGTIYVDDSCAQNFDAINPDGTLKWQVNGFDVNTSPAIDSGANIYVGSEHSPGLVALGAASPTPTPGNGRIRVNGKTKTLTLTLVAPAPNASATKTFTITNTGTGPLNGNVTLPKNDFGNFAGLFVEPGGGPFSIAAGGRKTVAIVFTPSKKGSVSDGVEITSDDPTHKKPITVKIEGKAE